MWGKEEVCMCRACKINIGYTMKRRFIRRFIITEETCTIGVPSAKREGVYTGFIYASIQVSKLRALGFRNPRALSCGVRASRIRCYSQKYFKENFDTSHHRLLLVIVRIFFNEIVKNSNSRKFRPAKYKRYTVIIWVCQSSVATPTTATLPQYPEAWLCIPI